MIEHKLEKEGDILERVSSTIELFWEVTQLSDLHTIIIIGTPVMEKGTVAVHDDEVGGGN